MERIVNTTPEKLLGEATAAMVAAGASVENRTADSVTFQAREGMSGGFQALTMLIGLWDFAGAASSMTAHGVHSENSGTLSALPTPDGKTRVVVADRGVLVNTLLQRWILADVLREHIPEPLMLLPQSYNKVEIYNNRVKAYKRRMFWRETDDLHMDDIDSVVVDKRLVSIAGRSGEKIEIKALVREDAR